MPMSEDVKHWGCVILADAHQNVLEGVRGLVEPLFTSVVMVADQNSLLETVNLLAPDLIVVDLSLPGLRDGNIIKQVAKMAPTTKILAVSMHDEPTAIEAVMSAGACAFVLKRAVSSDLIPAIRDVFQGRTYVSPSAERAAGS